MDDGRAPLGSDSRSEEPRDGRRGTDAPVREKVGELLGSNDAGIGGICGSDGEPKDCGSLKLWSLEWKEMSSEFEARGLETCCRCSPTAFLSSSCRWYLSGEIGGTGGADGADGVSGSGCSVREGGSF